MNKFLFHSKESELNHHEEMRTNITNQTVQKHLTHLEYTRTKKNNISLPNCRWTTLGAWTLKVLLLLQTTLAWPYTATSPAMTTTWASRRGTSSRSSASKRLDAPSITPGLIGGRSAEMKPGSLTESWWFNVDHQPSQLCLVSLTCEISQYWGFSHSVLVIGSDAPDETNRHRTENYHPKRHSYERMSLISLTHYNIPSIVVFFVCLCYPIQYVCIESRKLQVNYK